MSKPTITTDLANILNKLDSKIEARFDKIDNRFEKIDDRLNNIEVSQVRLLVITNYQPITLYGYT